MTLCDDERPLTEIERKYLRSKCTFLVDQLLLDHGLLTALHAVDCLNDRHLDGIKAHVKRPDQIGELLDIMKRRSFAQYKQFVECVRATHQEHVVRVFDSEGGNFSFV